MDDKATLIKRFNDGEFKTGLKDSSKENSVVILLEEDGYVFGYWGVREMTFLRQKIHNKNGKTKRFTLGISGYDLNTFTTKVDVTVPAPGSKVEDFSVTKKRNWVSGGTVGR